ncbi:hypothetical protein KUV57_11625 [Epibacterium sp. DP7N7-1]|nr:hypothetical protein [Epibacterium sp. DP7N7-1]
MDKTQNIALQQEQIDAISAAVRRAIEVMGLERIRSGEFFGMKQKRA